MYIVEWSKCFDFFQKIKKNIKPNIDDSWKPNTKSSTTARQRSKTVGDVVTLQSGNLNQFMYV